MHIRTIATLLSALPLLALADDKDQIVTDRPDFVESSNVVGAGRFQIETSFALDRNKANGIKERTYSTPTLLRFGINDTIEARLEGAPDDFGRHSDTRLIEALATQPQNEFDYSAAAGTDLCRVT